MPHQTALLGSGQGAHCCCLRKHSEVPAYNHHDRVDENCKCSHILQNDYREWQWNHNSVAGLRFRRDPNPSRNPHYASICALELALLHLGALNSGQVNSVTITQEARAMSLFGSHFNHYIMFPFLKANQLKSLMIQRQRSLHSDTHWAKRRESIPQLTLPAPGLYHRTESISARSLEITK